MDRAVNGIAGVNMESLVRAATSVLGVAGVDRSYKIEACLDASGAGHEKGSAGEPAGRRPLLADRTAREGYKKCVFFEDIWYLVKWDPVQKRVVWRKGFERSFGRKYRKLPLFLDSGAFRRFQEQLKHEKWLAGELPEKPRLKPAWSNDYNCYLQAIDLLDPDGYMSWDKLRSNQESYRGYQQMVSDGYGDKLIPVYQITEDLLDQAGALLEPVPYQISTDDLRYVVSLAQHIARDPIFREYASKHRTVGIGGMVKNPRLPVPARWVLFKELARLTANQGTILWGLGQACYGVVNQLGPEGLLNDRVSLDGSWWINHANTMQTIILVRGQLRNINWFHFGERFLGLTRDEVRDPDKFGIFNSRSEMMAMNIRALAGAFANCWKWPDPGPTVEEMEDNPEAAYVLGQAASRAHGELLDLYNFAPDLAEEIKNIPMPKPRKR